jgi:hypothetical protein
MAGEDDVRRRMLFCWVTLERQMRGSATIFRVRAGALAFKRLFSWTRWTQSVKSNVNWQRCSAAPGTNSAKTLHHGAALSIFVRHGPIPPDTRLTCGPPQRKRSGKGKHPAPRLALQDQSDRLVCDGSTEHNVKAGLTVLDRQLTAASKGDDKLCVAASHRRHGVALRLRPDFANPEMT